MKVCSFSEKFQSRVGFYNILFKASKQECEDKNKVITDSLLLMWLGKGWRLGLMKREGLFNFYAGTKGGYIIYARTQ